MSGYKNKEEIEKILESVDITGETPIEEPERQYYFIKKARKYVKEMSEKIGRTLTATTVTFGCQMNARDSEKLVGVLELIGYKEEPDEEKADFVIYNTCTVRENANLRVYGRLGQLGAKKKKNPHMFIGLCGCMMQEPTVVEKIKKSYRFVDLIFGTHNIYKFAELIVTRFESERMVIDIWKDTDKIVEDLPSERKFSFKSGVNIMFGCNNFCSYCIVPYVRGRERSRNPKDIIREIEGLERIRFMTSHPKDLSDELIDVMAHSKKICKHLHLPVKSGSSRILQKMNRHYTKEHYLEVVRKIREAVPDISLTTDIIVGFPGETEEDFQDTLDIVRQVRYDSAFTFIYSKRTGTPAAAMEDQVPDDVVKDRFERLLKEVQQISAEVCSVHQGTTQDVLVESVNDHDPSLVTGRMSNNLLVHFPGDESMIGKIVTVYLKEAKGFYYMGELCK